MGAEYISVPYVALFEAIEKATVQLEVAVPSRDFYARRGDYTTEHVTYLDAEKFRQALEAIINAPDELED